MLVCPHCGNEVEEYDCICGNCGGMINQEDNSFQGYNSNSGNSYNINSDQNYGNNNYNYNNNYSNNNYNGNYNYQNSGDYISFDNFEYPPYNSSGYNNSTVGYGNGTSSGSKGKSGNKLIGAAIAVLLVVVLAVALPLYTNSRNSKYRQIVQKSVEAWKEQDYSKFSEISIYDYNKMVADFSGFSVNIVSDFVDAQPALLKSGLREQYGDDYKITTKIKSSSVLRGSRKKSIIDELVKEMNGQISDIGINLNVENYFEKDKIDDLVRIKVKVKISGSKKSTTEDIWVVAAKVKGNSSWKLFRIYE